MILSSLLQLLLGNCIVACRYTCACLRVCVCIEYVEFELFEGRLPVAVQSSSCVCLFFLIPLFLEHCEF
jgi:hypothetical protein